MPVVNHTFVDDAGQPLANEWVRITLVSRTGWYADGTRKASRVHSDLTDGNGYWERNLPSNVTYEEAGTYYRVERGSDIISIEVPNGSGPYTLRAIVRDPIPVDAAWKVTPRLEELLGATSLAGATVAQVPAWAPGAGGAPGTWVPVARVEPAQLTTGLATKVDKTVYDARATSVDAQFSALTSRVSGAETQLGGKASSSVVSGIDSRVGTNTSDIATLKSKVAYIEGGGTSGGSGGTGGTAPVIHGGLRGLYTDPSSGAITDDHPQYLTAQRGDDRYWGKAAADDRYAALLHAARHKPNGADPLRPADIGAASATHSLADHPNDASQLIYPFVVTTTAAATSGDPSHAMLVTKVGSPSRGGGFLRSMRQPIVHDFDLDFTDVVPTSDTTIFTWDFTTREACDLWLDLDMYGYYYDVNPPNGATAQVSVRVQILDRDASNNRLCDWDAGFWVCDVGYGAYRPDQLFHCSGRLPTNALPAKRNLRMRVAATKDRTANADMIARTGHGGIHEVAAVGAF